MNNVRKLGYVLTLAVTLLAMQTIATACPWDDCCDCCCCCQPGCGTPGYWMNHPEAWPENFIIIGGVTYSEDEAIDIMKLPVAGNKVLSLFPALVAAELNVAIGNCDCSVEDAIDAADAWMAEYGDTSVKASSPEWQEIAGFFAQLDAYNNGLLCAPSRD